MRNPAYRGSSRNRPARRRSDSTRRRLRLEPLESRCVLNGSLTLDLNGPDEPGCDRVLQVPPIIDADFPLVDLDFTITNAVQGRLTRIKITASPENAASFILWTDNPHIGIGAAPHGLYVLSGLQDHSATVPEFMSVLKQAWLRLDPASTPLTTQITVIAEDEAGRSNVATVRFTDQLLPQHATTLGLFDPQAAGFFLRKSNTSGMADQHYPFGPLPGDLVPLAGDWDGDGLRTTGVYDRRTATAYLSNHNGNGYADIIFGYGDPGGDRLPVVGDFNHDGIDTLMLYEPSTSRFLARHSLTGGLPDWIEGYGAPGAGLLPIVGNWTGSGDQVGVYNPQTGEFDLNAYGGTQSFFFGAAGADWLPVAGDWIGQGYDSVGLYDPQHAVFYLRNTHTTGMADLTIPYGAPGTKWLPLVGDWDGPLVPQSPTLHPPLAMALAGPAPPLSIDLLGAASATATAVENDPQTDSAADRLRVAAAASASGFDLTLHAPPQSDAALGPAPGGPRLGTADWQTTLAQ